MSTEQLSIVGLALPVSIVAEPIFSDEQMIDAAFKWHRERGFPYRDLSPAICMKEINDLANTGESELIRTVVAYQVADTFNQHRSLAPILGKHSPFDSFHNDARLRKALELELQNTGVAQVTIGGMLGLVRNTQACANFRPGFACYLYRKYCPDNAVVLDTSTGYGGRLVGAIASRKVAHYIGIDPNTLTHAANLKMAETLGFADKVTLHNLPAEDLYPELIRESCDFSFTSPPYFSKEHYSDEDTQSWVRYKTGDEWREGFLRRMIELQFTALKPGSHNVINIAPVKIKKEIYPLDEWTVKLGIETGFEHVKTQQFPISRTFGAHLGENVKQFEPVLIFKKPELINDGFSLEDL